MTKTQATREVRRLTEAGYAQVASWNDAGEWRVYATDPTTGKRFEQLI
jgi:hypothetical protein